MRLTRILWVCINLDREGRPAISHLPPRGNLGNGTHGKGNALLLESQMLTFRRRPHTGTNPLLQASFMANFDSRPRLRWMNFNICPHCTANGRIDVIERLDERGPMISRSDGQNFHLVMWDPLESTCRHASLSIL